MDQTYDYIVLGTGLKECILGGLLSKEKASILQMDRNSYYGGESASLNLEQLYERFSGEGKGKDIDPKFGRPRDYCVDLCPKFLMACGNLVKVLLHTKVTRYLEFKSIAGSYVSQGGKPEKVPATVLEAGRSNLLSMIQKMRYKTFLQFVANYEHSDSKTHLKGFDMEKTTAKQLYEYYKIDENTQAFTGHAIALYLNDDYLSQPALPFIERAKLYAFSVARYGNSPYIYPIYGLGGLPEGFSRVCAIHGGVFMLNKPVETILFDDEGRVRGVKCPKDESEQGTEAYCKTIIADPSYFAGTDKVKKIGQVARCIAIMSKPIPNTNEDSAQIIIPSKGIKGRNKDIYIVKTSYHHKVCAQNKYIAVMSAEVEGGDIPLLEADRKACADGVQRELGPALALLPPQGIDKLFMWVTDQLVPVNDPTKDGCYISSSYDATTHFETTSQEVIAMYKAITGKDIDLTVQATQEALENPDEAVGSGEAEEPAAAEAAE
eukprot:gb/GEZN01004411.1/.p1 GENE.gb/GEZN01004411.1/~~gb/GEZN01004411.1/.p1  ORF type:complete len:491 (-),score=116.20 gb/GEZN01004411.1/:438-1910(-)